MKAATQLYVGTKYYFKSTIKNEGNVNFSGDFYLREANRKSPYNLFVFREIKIHPNEEIDILGEFIPEKTEKQNLMLYAHDKKNSRTIVGSIFLDVVNRPSKKEVSLIHSQQMKFYEDPAYQKAVENLDEMKAGSTYYLKAVVRNQGTKDFNGTFYLKVAEGLTDYVVIPNKIIKIGEEQEITGKMSNTKITGKFPLKLFYSNESIGHKKEVRGDLITITLKKTNSISQPIFSQPHQVNPQITIHGASVELAKEIKITGKNFTPNGKIEAFISYPPLGVHPYELLKADASGNIEFKFTAPSYIKNNSILNAYIEVTDKTTNKMAPTKSFNIIVPKSSNSSQISMILPRKTDIYSVGKPISVHWSDVLYRQANGINYPFDKHSGMRSYKYTIKYRTSANGRWITHDNISGFGKFDEIKNDLRCKPIVINAPTKHLQVLISDDYNPKIEIKSNILEVLPSGKIDCTYEWDYSYGKEKSAIRGVAAEGVGRFYIKISKIYQHEKIKTIKVTLSDDYGNKSPSMLGKIMKAEVTNKYSLEANDATRTSEIITGDYDHYYLWYVAPDNFSESASSHYAYQSTRTVHANILVTYESGYSLSIKKPIEIVRPPLVMVHGLNSDEHCWDNFHYIDNSGKNENFIDSRLFQHKKAINMFPSAEYMVNTQLVIMNPNNENSLYYNIKQIRRLGYACNQVDYVCHSMGGAVLRNSIEKHMAFYDSSPSDQYQNLRNYTKGLVNKAITINTPHNGSPLADLVVEYVPQIFNLGQTRTNIGAISMAHLYESNTMLRSFIEYDNGSIYKYKATGALKNLQVQGDDGVAFKNTIVKNHLIGGHYPVVSTQISQSLSTIGEYLDGIDIPRFVYLIYYCFPDLGSPVIDGSNKVTIAAGFLEWYSKKKGYPNFLSQGDLIVPLASQLATQPSPDNIYQRNATTVFKSKPIDFLQFRYIHTRITDRTEVGNHVLSLLNSDVNNSSFFANSIPANTVKQKSTTLRKGESRTTPKEKIQKEYFNTSKIEIVSPLRNSTLWVDHAVTIAYKLKDTTNLSHVVYYFQNNFDLIWNRHKEQSITQQVLPNLLGKQQLIVSAVYSYPDSVVNYTDTLSITVDTKASFLGFNIKETFINAYKGVCIRPTFIASYSNGVMELPYNSPYLNIEIDNPKVVAYNENELCFIGTDTLTTFASVTYRGISDTVYFRIMNADIVRNDNLNEDNDGEIMVNETVHRPETAWYYQGRLYTYSPIKEMIAIYDISGKLVFHDTKNAGETVFDLNLSEGIYIIKGTNWTRKIKI
ncbi:T9SS type A sorting domain-containing protein [Tannerella forsythia]|nr:T9SS type A sorting domain-containing protein [Tannerella forsythia]